MNPFGSKKLLVKCIWKMEIFKKNFQSDSHYLKTFKEQQGPTFLEKDGLGRTLLAGTNSSITRHISRCAFGAEVSTAVAANTLVLY